MNWVAVVQQLDTDLLAIELVRQCLSMQDQALKSIPLIDENSRVPISKSEFKDIGAARLIGDQVGIEALIGLTANAIETFSIRLKRHLGVNWDPFTQPMVQIRFAERVRQFRALNNVFKHQEGYIDSAASRSAKFLVDNGYFQNETYLKHLPAKHIVPDFELSLYETFGHLYDVCMDAARMPSLVDDMLGLELVRAIRKRVVYPVLQTRFGGA